MKKIVRLTERDLTRLVKKVIKEDEETTDDYYRVMDNMIEDCQDEILEVIENYKEKLRELIEEIDNDKKLEDEEIGQLIFTLKYDYMDDLIKREKAIKKLF